MERTLDRNYTGCPKKTIAPLLTVISYFQDSFLFIKLLIIFCFQVGKDRLRLLRESVVLVTSVTRIIFYRISANKQVNYLEDNVFFSIWEPLVSFLQGVLKISIFPLNELDVLRKFRFQNYRVSQT